MTLLAPLERWFCACATAGLPLLRARSMPGVPRLGFSNIEQTAEKVGVVLRRAQYERPILSVFKTSSVRPEPVEARPETVGGGERRGFSAPC